MLYHLAMLYPCTAQTLLMLAEKLSKPVERSRLWHRSKGGMDLAALAAENFGFGISQNSPNRPVLICDVAMASESSPLVT